MKQKILKYILPVFIISALPLISCFDMYNGIWNNTGNKYRLAIAGTSFTGGLSRYYFTMSDGGLDSPITVNPPFTSTIGSGFADFNKDGNTDMLLIQQSNNHVIYFFDGKGNTTGSVFTTFGGNASDGVITDIDSDNDPDIVITVNPGLGYILVNDGHGNFPGNISIGLASNSIASADFDGDGDRDLIVDDAGTNIQLLRNNSGSFVPQTPVNISNGVKEFAAADFDSDGDKDVIALSLPNGPLMMLNDGNGNFSPGWNDTYAGSQHYDIEIADVDSDGDMDAYICRAFEQYDLILINDGNGNMIKNYFFKPSVESSYAAVLADIDLDGNIDLLITTDIALRIYLNNGAGEFTLYKSYAAIPGTPTGLSAGAVFR